MSRHPAGAVFLAPAVVLAGAALLLGAALNDSSVPLSAQENPLVLGFHHVHMNVVDPGRSAAFYVKNFQSKRVDVAGWPAVQTEAIYILLVRLANRLRTGGTRRFGTSAGAAVHRPTITSASRRTA
jgi:hypothetical protein